MCFDPWRALPTVDVLRSNVSTISHNSAKRAHLDNLEQKGWVLSSRHGRSQSDDQRNAEARGDCGWMVRRRMATNSQLGFIAQLARSTCTREVICCRRIWEVWLIDLPETSIPTSPFRRCYLRRFVPVVSSCHRVPWVLALLKTSELMESPLYISQWVEMIPHSRRLESWCGNSRRITRCLNQDP